jgi:hypothetical protein
LSLAYRFVCEVVAPFISTVAPHDNGWSISKLSRFASEQNASGTRRIGGPLDITVTLITTSKHFWPGMIFNKHNVYINSGYEIKISRAKQKSGK